MVEYPLAPSDVLHFLAVAPLLGFDIAHISEDCPDSRGWAPASDEGLSPET